jgi:amino acid transporter
MIQEKLRRTIGPVSLSMAIVNITIGTGIFVLPALAAKDLGAGAIISYFTCGLAVFFIALCFAERGSKISKSGGTYAYIETAFGPYAGFLANTIFILGGIFSDAATATAIVKILGVFVPVVDTPGMHLLFYLALFGGLAYINIRGTESGMRFIIMSTLLKLIPLFLLIAFGFGHISMQNLAWKGTPSFHDIGSSTLVLFYAFVGIEVAVINGGEFKNPSRTVPLGILFGLSLVLLVYVSLQLVSQGVLGDHLQDFKGAPLVAVGDVVFGNSGKILIVIGTVFSMIGLLSGDMLAFPRTIYASARDGLFPQLLFRVQQKYATPYYAIILYAGVDYVLALFGGLEELLVLTSVATLLIYLGVAFSVIKLRFKKSGVVEKGYINPAGIAVPVIASVAVVWILFNLPWSELIGVFISIAVLSIIYLWSNGLRKEIKRIIKPNKQYGGTSSSES